ncbi:MAG: hypothetical protein PVF15_02675 [Candidatus Bathyarchaeota archaeon]|jgi:hypothetical protein
MQKRMLLGIMLLAIFGMTSVSPTTAADTLSPGDFEQESWSKTIDFFDYARIHAAVHGKTPPPANWHANLYMVYINVSGFQLLYAGLVNITTGNATLTIPVQNFLEHYKTQQGKDVLMSSSFITLLAFNDTTSSLYPDSPDINDNLYASFSLGLNLEQYFENSSRPALSSKTTVIPLTSSEDKLNWSWGMRYTNLTAIWWRMHPNANNPRYEKLPIAITTYEELTFTYNLTINPADHTATVTANYVLGRMTNLWLIHWLLFIPVVVHYNSTGAYWLNGVTISNETIYKFLENQNIKMSVVLYQNSFVLNHNTQCSYGAQNVTDAEVDVSSGAITTSADDGEKVFETDFGTKETYNLYNYTADPTEETYDTYDAGTRTKEITGYARNPIFDVHTALLRLVPLVIAHMRPELYQNAKDRIMDMTRADCFYITSYPTYSGFRVEHDPTYTAYIAVEEGGPAGVVPNWGAFLFAGMLVAAIAVVGVVLAVKRRGGKVSEISQTSRAIETT